MKNFKPAICFIGTTVFVTLLVNFSYADDGPFGVSMGTPVESLNCDASDTPTMYYCESLPKPHPDMDVYIVQSTPASGVCWVKALGKDISDNGFGLNVQSSVDKLKDQIASKYGAKFEAFDFLVYGSLWDQPDDWMMGLALEDRYYAYTWTSSSGYVSVSDVEGIYLGAHGSSGNSAYIVVEFAFSNSSVCDEAVAQAGSDAF